MDNKPFCSWQCKNFKNDMNDDGFLDNPLGKQINITNRWQYSNPESGWVSFLNFRFMNDEKQTGQIDFNPDRDRFTTNFWGSEINTQRFDFASKQVTFGKICRFKVLVFKMLLLTTFSNPILG
jgi:hypothetical protein